MRNGMAVRHWGFWLLMAFHGLDHVAADEQRGIPSRHDPFKGCFLQLEGSYGDILVPVQYYFEGRPTWRGVDPENGNYVPQRLFFLVFWVLSPDFFPGYATGGLRDANGGDYSSDITCFDDTSRVTGFGTFYEIESTMYRLLAPYYTTCRPKKGEPDLQKPYDVIPIDVAEPKSLRDCVAAAATRRAEAVAVKAVIFYSETAECMGVVAEEVSLARWRNIDDSSRHSCVVGCLPLRGSPEDLVGLVSADAEGISAMQQCDARGTAAAADAVGTYMTRNEVTKCYAVTELTKMLLVSPEVEAENSDSRCCFSPRGLYGSGMYGADADSSSSSTSTSPPLPQTRSYQAGTSDHESTEVHSNNTTHDSEDSYMNFVVIGGASGAGALLIGVAGFCCYKCRKQNSEGYYYDEGDNWSYGEDEFYQSESPPAWW